MNRIALSLATTALAAAVAVTPAVAGNDRPAVKRQVHRAVVRLNQAERVLKRVERESQRRRPRPIVRLHRIASRPGVFLAVGNVTTTPVAGATSLSLTVTGGDNQTLRLMLGQPTTQSFAVDASTKYWKIGKGAAALSDLAQGDLVYVEVRAPRTSTLAEVEAKPAVRVLDRGQVQVGQHLTRYVFRGTLASVGSSSLAVTVASGNVRALQLMIGQPAAQTFAFDASTKFVRVQNGERTTVTASQLQAGDQVIVLVRADAAATLSQVEAAAAAGVLARPAESAQ